MRRTRDKASTIREQLTRIVLIPSLCFLALWLIVAAIGTVQAVQLMGAVTQAREGTQVFSDAAEQLRAERRLSLVYLGRFERNGPDTEVGSALDEQRGRTDTVIAEAVELAEQLRGTRDDEVQRSAITLLNGPKTLSEVRLSIDEHSVVQEEVLLDYGEVLESTADATNALVHTTDGGENLTDAVLTSELLNAQTDYATADALLAGVIARGEMSYEETAHFTYLTASYRDALGSAAAVMHPSVRAHYDKLVSQQAWIRAEDLSRQVVTRPPILEARADGDAADEPSDAFWNTAIDVGETEWDESSAGVVASLDDLAQVQAERTVSPAWNAALLRLSLVVAASALTLVCGVTAITVVSRSSRRLTDRLARLRGQILERDEDLPDIVERAQRGQKVDVQEELPPLDECSDDEIGQVAEAFDSAQLTAVEAAVRQAEIRRGANRASLGIAFRNQNLVQRQLRLLDEIECHEQDPEALRRLFRLDHLATRARRYADNLIILGGGQSARRWRQPRPLVDVLRAAISETEDFDRVRLTSAPRVLVHGQAVTDVVHLLAELVENATQFSPAGTPVDVSCTPDPEGLLVEVEDRGLGMSEHGYTAAERTLAQPQEFDVMALPDDPRLGLFVVARLADRHGVRVWLRPSPYGGTRATALIPGSLLEPVENPVTVTGEHGPVDILASPHGTAVAGDPRPPLPLRVGSPEDASADGRGGHGHAPQHTGPQNLVPPYGSSGQGFAPSTGQRVPQRPVPPGDTGEHQRFEVSGPPGIRGTQAPEQTQRPTPRHGGPVHQTGPQTPAPLPPRGRSGS